MIWPQLDAPLAFLNGEFVPPESLLVSHADAGFVFGATVTDFCRTYGGTLFRHADHLRRFRHDCAAIGIALPFRDGELSLAARHLVATNRTPGDEVAVIAFATPGVPGAGRPTVGMHTVALTPARYAHLHGGAVLRTAGELPAGIVPAGVKHRSRLSWYLAERAVNPGEVAVLLDEHGTPDAALGSVLAVVAGGVVRPPAGRVLEGVTLGVVAELCAELGLGFAEGAIDFRDLPGGVTELLLAGSGFGLAAVASFDGRAFPAPGRVAARLLAAFDELVSR